MLSEAESVAIDLLAEAADIVPDLVIYLGQLLLRFLGHLHYVKLRVHVTYGIIKIGALSGFLI